MSGELSAPPRDPTPPVSAEGAVSEPLLRPTTGGHRKKSAWVRSWVVVDPSGEAQVVEAGKYAIMRRTGIPARDLRILDPVLTYPSTILGRERAVVVNLEHIKTIITAHEVLFLNAKDPLVTPFVAKLQGIFRQREAVKSTQEAGVGSNNKTWANLHSSEEPHPTAISPHQFRAASFHSKDREGNADGAQQAGDHAHTLKLLPFEFVALEACLESACSSLDDEAARLEQEAHPALDRLTSKISTLNLERVRQIKSRLVAITGRVQKVRDELEHLLDDDEDMAEMYLTEKFEELQLQSSSASSENEVDDINEEGDPHVDNRNPEKMLEIENEQEQEQPNEEPHRTLTSSTMKNFDVQELEMILEAYFVQIEGTLNKLSTLREYVDDTEDYLNIMLDDKQNHLLQMGVLLSTATVVVSSFIAMSGVFGMNISIELFDDGKSGMPQFLWTVAGGAIACIVMYVAAIAWYKYKRLLV